MVGRRGFIRARPAVALRAQGAASLFRYPDWKKQVSFHVFEGIAHKEDPCYADPALLDFVFE